MEPGSWALGNLLILSIYLVLHNCTRPFTYIFLIPYFMDEETESEKLCSWLCIAQLFGGKS